jgi:DNA processing protein
LGVDGAAHEGALEASGPTVAVIGTGPESIYPRKHLGLAQRIVRAGGAIVSEYAPGMPVRSENFPLRNRIIAGLSLGTLVVEAALESGSLITAKLAVESGREVFAIPGSIHSPHSKGCHALIRQGAKLVETAADILEEFSPGIFADARVNAASTSTQDAIPALGHDPVTLDALSQRTGQSVAEVAAWLLELELQGQVARLPGGLFQRRALP